MRKALKVSKKNIISIREYSEFYLGTKFTLDGKLTHDRLTEFMHEKGKAMPRRGIIKNIKNEDILKGFYYLVKDETGQVIPYFNLNYNLNYLLEDLKKRKNELPEKRRKNLKEQGLRYNKYEEVRRENEVDPEDYDEETVMSLGSLLVSNNRVKKLVRNNYNQK